MHIRRTFAILATLSLLTMVFSQEKIIPSVGEGETLLAETSSGKNMVKNIKLMISATEDTLNRSFENTVLIAAVGDSVFYASEGIPGKAGQYRRVKDPDSWPDRTLDAFVVGLNADGAVIGFMHVPTSPSGDWFNYYTHYFDSNGLTAGFYRHSAFFNGCSSGLASENSTYYFDSRGRLIAKDYNLIGKDDQPLDPDECEFLYRYEYPIYRTWEDLMEGLGIELFFRD